MILRACADSSAEAAVGCKSGDVCDVLRCKRPPVMDQPTSESAAAQDVSLLDCPPLGAIPRDVSPQWLWVLVRSTGDPPEQVWVRYQAELAPEGLDARPAAPPKGGSLGVAILRIPPVIEAAADSPEGGDLTRPRRKYSKRRSRLPPTDRNLVTAQEFANHVGCSASSVHELVKIGLPNIKAPGIGRRILKEQAVAWLIGGGARKSKVALKLARAAYRAKRATANGAPNGSG